jgi:penicillin-binding protein 2
LGKKKTLKRINVFLGAIVLIFVVLIVRVSYLQLIETEHYRTLARENTLRLITIPAPRGEIFDRHGTKLVGNRPLYTVSLVNLGQTRDELEPVVEKLSVILDRTPEELWEAIAKQSPRRYEPIRLARDVPLEIVSRIEEQQLDDLLRSVVIDLEPMREYPFGSTLAHVLGYVREIQPEQLERHREDGYRMGDAFGQAGLENTQERMLRGIKGARQVEVDAYARPVRSLGIKDPVPGNDLILTIDLKVQLAAEEALAWAVAEAQKMGNSDSQAASAVVIDVRTGEILALASYPAYDPSVFAGDLSPVQAHALMNAPDQPFLNRAIQSAYPPGSTFKMVVGAAALETGKIDQQFTVFCPGYFYHERRYNCWNPAGHGTVDLVKGLQVSCNTYFWTVGLKTGPEIMARFAREFGLGERTGIELPGEVAGVVPTAEYKRRVVQAELDRRFGPQFEAVEERYRTKVAMATGEARDQLQKEKQQELARIQAQYDRYAWDLVWRDYDTLNMAIGQGIHSYTPLQLANYVAAIANGGKLYRPYLVQRIVAPDGTIVKEFGPELRHRVPVSEEHLALIREGMFRVNQPGGTAYGSFYDFPLPTAGKTGTAEVLHKNNHALFVGFAPYEEAEIAVAVVVEHGGQGSRIAAPVARRIMDAYFGFLTEDEEEADQTSESRGVAPARIEPRPRVSEPEGPRESPTGSTEPETGAGSPGNEYLLSPPAGEPVTSAEEAVTGTHNPGET